MDPVLRPYPQEHACRLREPGDFQADSFRRIEREHEGKKYSVIMGKLTGQDAMTEQAYRYPKDTWSADSAGSHCKSHDGRFEAASGQEQQSADGDKQTYQCECLSCGHTMESEKHCRDIKCPKCGGTMRRAERPGPGQESISEGNAEDESCVTCNEEGAVTVDMISTPAMQKKVTSCDYQVREVDRKERTAVFAINTDHLDRDKEVLLPGGADLKNYNKNPVVMYGHDYSSLPIGRALWTKKVKEEGRDVLLSKPRFAPTQFATDVFNLVSEGFLNTASVGFMPEPFTGRTPTEDEIKKRPDWKDAKRVYDKWDLLEWSIVPVPSNPYALARAVINKGILLPEGMTLGTLGGGPGEMVDKASRWSPQLWEPKCHEAIWKNVEAFNQDSFERVTWRHDGNVYVAITGVTVNSDENEGKRETCKNYYPVDSWTAKDALMHAADRRAVFFIEAQDRIRKLATVAPVEEVILVRKLPPVTPDEIEVRWLPPVEPERIHVRKLTTQKEIRAIEEARMRGRIIY